MDESVPQIMDVVFEEIADVFVPGRLRLACRHTSQAPKRMAIWVSKEMCVGVISTPADEQTEQDDLGTGGVSNSTVLVHVCGVDVVSSFGDCCRQE